MAFQRSSQGNLIFLCLCSNIEPTLALHFIVSSLSLRNWSIGSSPVPIYTPGWREAHVCMCLPLGHTSWAVWILQRFELMTFRLWVWDANHHAMLIPRTSLFKDTLGTGVLIAEVRLNENGHCVLSLIEKCSPGRCRVHYKVPLQVYFQSEFLMPSDCILAVLGSSQISW
jgi:hypothetical protein